MGLNYSEDLSKYFCHLSMMEILGVDRDECAHSQFLGWLFENAITGKEATSLLINMLQDGTAIPSEEIDDVKVLLEDFVEVGEYHGRADIVIDVTYKETEHLHIIIENKIDSLEHKMGKGQKSEDQDAPWQTEGYYDYYTYTKYKNEDCLFAYLTRPKNQIDTDQLSELYIRKDGGPQCGEFKWITYQDLLDRVLIPLKETIPADSEEWMRVEDYIRCLGINKTQDNLIAASKELKAIADKVWSDEGNKAQFEKLKNKDVALNEFWEANKSLIQPLFKVLRYLYPETRTIKDIDKVVNGKDTTKYEVTYNGNVYKNLSKNGLVKTVVELYIQAGFNDLDTVRFAFSPKLRMLNKGKGADPASLSNQVVAKKDSKPNKWELLDGKSDWYVNQSGWDGKEMMNYFIAHAKKLLKEEIDIHEVVPNKDPSSK